MNEECDLANMLNLKNKHTSTHSHPIDPHQTHQTPTVWQSTQPPIPQQKPYQRHSKNAILCIQRLDAIHQTTWHTTDVKGNTPLIFRLKGKAKAN